MGSRGLGPEATLAAANSAVESLFGAWREALNAALRDLKKARRFAPEDTEKSVSYWYVLSRLIAHAARANTDVLRAADAQAWIPTGLSLAGLYEALPRYKSETVRRYVTDLKKFGLLQQDERGDQGELRLSGRAIGAYVETWGSWDAAISEAVATVRQLANPIRSRGSGRA
jgi:hypothetical protein